MTQTDQNAQDAQDFLAKYASTQTEAMALISTLRAAYGLVGTEFSRDDVLSQAEVQCEELGTYRDSIVETVMNGYEFQKLDDTLSERGNEVIADAVSEQVGILEGALGYEFTAVLVAVVDGEHVDVVEHPDFEDAAAATEWGSDQMGRTVSEVIETEEGARPAEDAPEGAGTAQVVGLRLIALRGGVSHAEFTASFEV